MFDVISRIPGDTRVASQKAGTPSSASSALYDQILRSVLLSMESPANSTLPLPLPAPAAADEAPVQGIRTLEDVMMQRQFVCSVHDTDSALTLDQLALQPQSLTTLDESERSKTNALLAESLNPWELLLGRLTLQQRLAV